MIKVDLQKINNYKVSLAIEVGAEDVSKEIETHYWELSKSARIPGFRKGKVPREILEARFHKEVMDEVLQKLVPKVYLQAVKEKNLNPVGNPDIEVVKFAKKEPLIFKATVEVKPEINLGSYRGIEVQKGKVVVKEEDVERHLENLRERMAELVVVEDRPLQKGDYAILDYEGTINGVSFPNGKGENKQVRVGIDALFPGFEEQLIGARPKEEREVKVVFPQDYPKRELAGKEAMFKVKIKEIKMKKLLLLDDEFAKDVGEFNTLEELKEKIRGNLRKQAEVRIQEELKGQIVEKLLKEIDFEAPPSLVEKEASYLKSRFEQRIRLEGIGDEQLNQEKLEILSKEEALKRIKTSLILEAIADKENITLTEEELDQEIEALAAATNQKFEVFKNQLRVQGALASLSAQIREAKTLDFLLAQAAVREV